MESCTLSCGLPLFQLSNVSRQTVICSTVFVYSLLHHGTFHRSPLLLELICLFFCCAAGNGAMKAREGERENFSICLYFHAHTWQAKAHERMENKERIEEFFFYICLP